MSLLFWLLKLKPVFLCKFVRHLKNDPLIQEVELLNANPIHAHIRYGNGCELTVSLYDLVPCLLQTLVNEYSGADSVTKEEPRGKNGLFSN